MRLPSHLRRAQPAAQQEHTHWGGGAQGPGCQVANVLRNRASAREPEYEARERAHSGHRMRSTRNTWRKQPACSPTPVAAGTGAPLLPVLRSRWAGESIQGLEVKQGQAWLLLLQHSSRGSGQCQSGPRQASQGQAQMWRQQGSCCAVLAMLHLLGRGLLGEPQQRGAQLRRCAWRSCALGLHLTLRGRQAAARAGADLLLFNHLEHFRQLAAAGPEMQLQEAFRVLLSCQALTNCQRGGPCDWSPACDAQGRQRQQAAGRHADGRRQQQQRQTASRV